MEGVCAGGAENGKTRGTAETTSCPPFVPRRNRAAVRQSRSPRWLVYRVPREPLTFCVARIMLAGIRRGTFRTFISLVGASGDPWTRIFREASSGRRKRPVFPLSSKPRRVLRDNRHECLLTDAVGLLRSSFLIVADLTSLETTNTCSGNVFTLPAIAAGSRAVSPRHKRSK